MNWLCVLTFLKSVAPAIYVLADAFRYGVNKHGDGTWRDQSPGQHVNKAIERIQAWTTDRQYSTLADAGLRIVFALSQVATGKTYKPKPAEPKPAPAALEKPEAEKNVEIAI